MAEITFSIMQLIEEVKTSGERFITPTESSFNSLEDSFSYSKDKTYYEISIKKSNDYAYFICDFGNPEPRDENLTNIKTGSKTPNQRTSEETELNNQAFFLFHYEKKRMYVSNSQKKGLLESILKEKLNTDYQIKPIFKGKDEFINTLQSCNKISFTHINNLFSNDSDKKQALIDLTGTDAPDEFTISAKYKKEKIVGFIDNIFQAKQDNKIDSLVICGTDESGFETIYNVDTFQQKIKITATKDDNGKFDADEVCSKLLNEISK